MEVTEAIRKIANTGRNPALGIICTVVSVDATTCVCSPIDGSADIEGVRLKAGTGNGVLITPQVDSFVIVQMVNDVEGYVSMFSQVETIKYLDGSFSGIVKADVLKTELDKTNEVVNALVTALTTWTPVSNDGGAALKALAISQLSGKAVGNYGSIKNDKITHGA